MTRIVQNLVPPLLLLLGACSDSAGAPPSDSAGVPAGDDSPGGLTPEPPFQIVGGPPTTGGQTGAEDQETQLVEGCGGSAKTDLMPDEKSPAGFSANDVLEAIGGPHRETWRWHDGQLATATLAIEADGASALWHDTTDPNFFPDGGPALECAKEVWVAAQLVLKTDDGRLDESWAAQLVATDVNQVSASPAQPINQLLGTFDPVPLAGDSEVDSYSFYFSFTAGTAWGRLTINVAEQPPDASQQLVSVSPKLVGELGASPEIGPENP